MFTIRIKEHGYGFFPGGDPRCFSPDGDSTEDELANHAAACKAWDDGERSSQSDCQHFPGVILTRCQFGLGSYTYEEDISPWAWLRWVAYPRTSSAVWRWWEWQVKPLFRKAR